MEAWSKFVKDFYKNTKANTSLRIQEHEKIFRRKLFTPI